MPSDVENTVLDKVGEMLTENIYDLIPGYAELEADMQSLTSRFEDEINNIKQITLQIDEMQT